MPLTVEQMATTKKSLDEMAEQPKQISSEFLEPVFVGQKKIDDLFPVNKQIIFSDVIDMADNPEQERENSANTIYFANELVADPDDISILLPDIIEKTKFNPAKAKPEERGFFGNVTESWRRGDAAVMTDIAVYEAAFRGTGDENRALKAVRKLQLEQILDPIEGNWLADLVYSGVEVAPGMARGYWSAIPQAFAGMSAGASMALAAGQAPPLTAAPEEIGTVPAGAVLGLKFGLMTGSATFWYEQGAGSMYAAMREKDYDPKLSKYISGVAAMPYAIVEFLQVSQLTPGLRQGALKVAQNSMLRVISNATKKYGAVWTEEVFEEVVQETIQIVAEDTAGFLSNKLKLPEGISKFLLDRGRRLWQTTKEAGKAMALLPIPGASIDVYTGKRNILTTNQKAEINKELPIREPVPPTIAVKPPSVAPGAITPAGAAKVPTEAVTGGKVEDELIVARGTRAAADIGGVQAVGAKNLKAADKILEQAGEQPVSRKVNKITEDFLKDLYTNKKPPVVGDSFTAANGFRIEVTNISKTPTGATAIDYQTFPKKGKGRTSTVYVDKPLTPKAEGKAEGNLIQEAKKFKTVEEFIDSNTKVYSFTKDELKNKNIEDFVEGDLIKVNGKYVIRIKYGKYNHPSLKTTVSKLGDFKEMTSTPGVKGGRPYFLDNFISARKEIPTKQSRLTEIWNKAKAQPPTAEAVTEGKVEGNLIQEAKKYKTAEEFVESYSLFHGTPAEIEGGKLKFGAGKQLKKGGYMGGHFLADKLDVAKVFQMGGNMYRASGDIKNKVFDVNSNKNLFANMVGENYTNQDGEVVEFTQNDYDFMFPDGKDADWATINADIVEQVAKERGKIGFTIKEFAGGVEGTTFRIFEDEIPVYTEQQLTDIWNKAQAQPAEGKKAKPAAKEHLRTDKFPTIELPVKSLKLSKDVPNFKEGADQITGVVKGEELQGEYTRLGTGPIVVWERINGDLEVVTGRHRLDLAKRSGEKTIPVQLVKESEGFNKKDALTIDAESNIRSGQGRVRDYAQYFKNTEITEESARERGLLSRAKGKVGFRLGKSASDDVYTGFLGGKLSEAKAYAIANGAPNNDAVQAAVLAKADKFSPDELEQYAKILLRTKPSDKVKHAQGEIWGFDDSVLLEAEAVMKEVTKEEKTVKDRILAVKGALRRPEAARKMGLEFTDEASIRKEVERLENRLDDLKRTSTTPELYQEMRQRAGLAREEKRPTDLIGRPILKGGAVGKQAEFLDKEKYKTLKEREKIVAAEDLEGQKTLRDISGGIDPSFRMEKAVIAPEKKPPGLTKAEVVHLGKREQAALRAAQAKGLAVGYKKGAAETVEKARTSLNAFRMKEKINEQMRIDATNIVLTHVPKEKQGVYIRRILDAKTQNRITKLTEAIDKYLDKAEKRQAIRDFKKFVGETRREYRRGEVAFGKLPKKLSSKLVETLDKFDLAKISEKKKETLGSRLNFVTRISDELANGFEQLNEGMDKDAVDLLMMGTQRIEELRRLSQTPTADLDTEQIQYIQASLEHLLKINEQKGQSKTRRRMEKLRTDINTARQEVLPAKEEVVEFTGILGAIRWVAVEGQSSIRTLIGLATGKNNEASKRILISELAETNNTRKATYKSFIMYFRELAKKKGITWNDIKSLKEIREITIGGKNIKIDYDILLGLYAHTQAEGNLRRLLKTKGLNITTYFRDEHGIFKKKHIYRLGKPNLAELRAITESIPDAHKKLVDVYFRTNWDKQAPAINEMSMEYQNYDLARQEKYFHVSREIERLVEGRKAETSISLDQQSRALPRKGGNARINIKSFTHEVMDNMQWSAAYSTMTMAMENARTLLANTKWREAMKSAGQGKVLKELTTMLRRAQGLITDQSVIELTASRALGTIGKSILSFRISGGLIQTASMPAAIEFIGKEYLFAIDVPTPALITKLKKIDPVLWTRWEAKQFDYALGMVGAQNAFETLLFEHPAVTDKFLAQYTAGDQIAIAKLFMASERKIEKETRLEKGTDAFQKATLDLLHEAMTTQPQWDMINRSPMTSDPSLFTRSMSMFMAARNAQYNVIVRAMDDFRKGRITKGQLSERLTGVGVSNLLVSLVRHIFKMSVKYGAIAFLVALRLRKPPTEEELEEEAMRLAEKIPTETVFNLVGLNVVGGLFASMGYAALKARKYGWREGRYSDIRTGNMLADLSLDVMQLGVDFALFTDQLISGEKYKSRYKWEKTGMRLIDDISLLIAYRFGLPYEGPKSDIIWPVKSALKEQPSKTTLRKPKY